MIDLRHIRRTKRYLWYHTMSLWLFWPMIVMTSACIAQSAVTQSPSPLPLRITSLLVGTRWEIVEITFHNELIQFDSLTPIYVWFEAEGVLNFTSPHCPGGAFLIFFEDERHYKLTRGQVAAVDCGELRAMQFAHVLDALRVTTEYEIQDDHLFLTGEDVRIVLEIDNMAQ